MAPADTIAAAATGTGPAAVGIVRISGPDAFSIGRRICARWPDPLVGGRAHLSDFLFEGLPFDAGLVLPFLGPRSYTGEDVLELQGHGGHAQRRLLIAVCSAGARLAEPGEFTQRAFLAGKLDLIQAEAVAKLVAAQTDRALQAAQASLGGALSSRVGELESELARLRGRVEGLLDFPAESEGAEAGLPLACAALSERVGELAQSFSCGRRLFSRSEVVLVGPVNAGKSSLFNALLGEERALVDADPGTTRDLVTADVELGGLPVRFVDTAGWRAAAGVEARGIALGREAASRAAAVVWVSPADAFEPAPQAGWIQVSSKCDLAPGQRVAAGALAVSAHGGEGLEALRAELVSRLLPPGSEEELLVIGERQAQELAAAAGALARAAAEPAVELVAEELAAAAGALARVTGTSSEPEILDEVFRQFCIGK